MTVMTDNMREFAPTSYSAICDPEGLRKALEAVGMNADKIDAILAEIAQAQH